MADNNPGPILFHGGERRQRICSDETCRQVADAAVQRVFEIIGVDVHSPESVADFNADLRWGGKMRRATDRGVVVLVSAFFAGVGLALWAGLQVLLHGSHK